MSNIPVGTGTLFVLDKTGVKKTSKKEEKNADSGKGGEEDLFKFCEDQPEKNPRDDDADDDDDDDEIQIEKSSSRRKMRLIKETKSLNITEREESFAVQYMALGGLANFSFEAKKALENNQKPLCAASSVHSGAGQQTFGYSVGQKADLMMCYEGSESQPNRICYHNYHGHMWHYRGHLDKCPQKSTDSSRFIVTEMTKKLDNFKKKLAQAWSEIRPKKVIFDYTCSYACQLYHGTPVFSLDSKEKTFYSVKECLLEERPQEAWFPPAPQKYFDHNQLKLLIKDGKIDGFVTIKGGCEREDMKYLDPAGSRFGFCVQNYAPSPSKISPFTKEQIARFYGWIRKKDQTIDLDKVDAWLSKQPPRTINSGTFHVEETVSTSYLRWLMQERKFDEFTITHFLAYQFRNWSGEFIEPVLQTRHDCKLRGDNVAAECLKLIGNGSYGYNGLESCNYDTVHLLTEESLTKRRGPGGNLRHVKLKHVSLIGLVQKAKKIKNQKANKNKKTKMSGAEYLDKEAIEDCADVGDSSDDNSKPKLFRPKKKLKFDQDEKEQDLNDEIFDIDSDCDSTDDMKEEAAYFDYKHYISWQKNLKQEVVNLKIESSPIDHSLAIDSVRACKSKKKLFAASMELKNADGADDDDDDENFDSEQGEQDLEELLIKEKDLFNPNYAISLDHSYAKAASFSSSSMTSSVDSKNKEYSYHFLYAACFSGEDKKIFNNLPKAVAVLSNSKKIFLGHLSVMFRCLDPCLAELTYTDTDSCIWSLTAEKLEDCLLPEMMDYWKKANIIANEGALVSCHGKMKLEGSFVAGQFRTMKIYRLYKQSDEIELESKKFEPAYTRCKGVNRYIATRLPDSGFDSLDPESIVVHRNALKPTRKGEIHLVHEARSVSVPFNLKRFVCEDGYHTLPFFSTCE